MSMQPNTPNPVPSPRKASGIIAKQAMACTLSLVLAVGLVPGIATAAPANDNSATHAAAAEDTVEISTEQQLRNLATAVNGGDDYSGKTVVLTADIQLTGDWTPIGTRSPKKPFSGTFDGQGHTISGISIESPKKGNAYVYGLGLFAYTKNATIKNLTVNGMVTGGDSFVGGVVGVAEGTDFANVCNNASVSSTYVDDAFVGGIAGQAASSSTFTQCYNRGAVSGQNNIGGIAGSIKGGTEIASCYNLGAVVNTAPAPAAADLYTGGITGDVVGSTLSGCYNAGTVSAAGEGGLYIGSITGSDDNSAFEGPNYWLGSTCVFGNGGDSDAPDQYLDDYKLSLAEISDPSTASALNEALGNDADATWVSGLSLGQNSPAFSWQLAAGTPTITAQPSDVWCVQNTRDNKLSVTASAPAGGTVSYQWYRHTAPTTGDTPFALSDENKIEGATSAEYVVPTTAVGDAEYFCVISTGGKSIISAVATVTVADATPSSVTVALQSDGADASELSVMQGLSKELTASATFASDKGQGDLSYQWLESQNADGSDATPIPNETEATYAPETRTQGTTYYFCEVTNTYKGHAADAVRSAAAKVTVAPLAIDSVATLEQFGQAIASGINYQGSTVALASDLDLSSDYGEGEGKRSWTPLGMGGFTPLSFNGTFDGQGHTISGLYLNASSYSQQQSGLFAKTTNGTIKNLVVSGTASTTAGSLGGIVGSASGTTFENVGNEVTLTNAASYASSAGTGGIAGALSGNCTFTNCYNKSNIASGIPSAGGLAGYLSSYGAMISFVNCYNLGNVSYTGTSSANVGGLAAGGSTSDAASATFQNCYNAGTVDAGSNKFSVASAFVTGAATFKNGCYYLEGPAQASLVGKTEGTANEVTAATLKSASFLDSLNKGAAEGATPFSVGASLGQAYPALSWEIEPGTPVLTSLPSDSWVAKGDTPDALSVSATTPAGDATGHDGTITYQWYRADDASGANPVAIEGATAATYAPSAAKAGTFYYYCKATNTWADGSQAVNTPTVTFTVFEEIPAMPIFTAQPASVTLEQGDKAKPLVARAGMGAGTAGKISYQWYAASDAEGKGAQAISGATGESYTPSTDEVGAFYYYCVATNVIDGVLTTTVTSDVATVSVRSKRIATADELKAFAEYVNGGGVTEGRTYTLTANIDLSGAGNWSVIGDNAKDHLFKGTFDGGGYTISGLTFNQTEGRSVLAGLFGYTNGATIKNLNLSDVQISTVSTIATNSNTAAVVASARGGKIESVQVLSGTVSGAKGNVGGVVANCYDGAAVVDCGNAATVTNTDADKYARVGGVLGKIANSTTSIAQVSGCYNKGAITGNSAYTGGVAGYAQKTALTSCYNTGTVTNNATLTKATDLKTGGILGGSDTRNVPTVANCYNTGKIELPNAGGFAYLVGAVSGCDAESVYAKGASYYLKDSYSSGTGVASSDPETVFEYDATAMGAPTFVGTLNGTANPAPWVAANAGMEQRTPFLSWEAQQPPVKQDGTVTITDASALSKIYDGTAVSAPTFTVAEDMDASTAVVEYAPKPAEGADPVWTTTAPAAAGSYLVRVTIPESAAFNEASAQEEFTISPKEISVKASAPAASKQYDGTTAATVTGLELEGVVDGDHVGVQATSAQFAETGADVATAEGKQIALTATLELTGSSAGNYTLTQPKGLVGTIYNRYTAERGTDYDATAVSETGWIGGAFTVAAKDGYQLSKTNTFSGDDDPSWVSELSSAADATDNGSLSFYVRNTKTGAISLVTTEKFKIDPVAPSVSVTGKNDPVSDAGISSDTAVVTAAAGASGITRVEMTSGSPSSTTATWTALTPDKSGTYSFPVTKNGIYTVRVVNGAGATDMAAITYTNIGTAAPDPDPDPKPELIDLSSAIIGGVESSYQFTGKPIEPQVTVALGGKALVKGADYTVAYGSNTEPGTATVTVTGIGGYTGTASTTFTIAKKENPAPNPGDSSFSDIDDPTAWYYSPVYFLAEKGLVSGYEGTSLFGVGNAMTRAEFATILWRHAVAGEAASYDPSTTRNETGLIDVKGYRWYTGAANWAVRTGVINGVDNGNGTRSFVPDDTISFQEAIAILANFTASEKAVAGADPAVLDGFTDPLSVAAWAEQSMAWGVEVGLVSGYDNGDGTSTLNAGEYLTRERGATILYNAFMEDLLR